MGFLVLFRVCLLLVMACGSASQTIKKPITCEAGTFVGGQPAAITCNLHAVNATGSGVNLVRYLSGYSQRINILLCGWQQKTNSHQCVLETGYEFDHTITDSLTVKIKAVSDEYSGLHSCFLVPPDGTESHACELIVKDQVPTTTPLTNSKITPAGPPGPPDEGVSFVPWVVIALALVAVIALLVVGNVYFLKQRATTENKTDDHSALMPLMLQAVNARFPFPENMLSESSKPYPKEQVEECIKCFRLQDEDLQQIMRILKEELNAHEDTCQKANITMFPTVLNRLPNGTEKGKIVVVNLSSRCLKVLLVNIGGSVINCKSAMTFDISAVIRHGTSNQLFDFIANNTTKFLKSIQRLKEDISIAFVFSFPLKYDVDGDLIKARPVRWTKGFDCKGVVDNLGKRLQKALKDKGCFAVVKAIVNDAVGTLVSGVFMKPQCKISFVLGNGVNGCFLQEKDNSPKKVIVSTEWGALGEPTLPEIYRTGFDRELDKGSVNPGGQMLEKMVSRLYIGGIVRLVLHKLIEEGLLFENYSCKLPAFNEKGVFTTEHVTLIQSDNNENHLTIQQVLQELKVQSFNATDITIVKNVCDIVVKRAAYLAAAALAALITHTGQQHVTVAIGGSLYRLNHVFQGLLQTKTQQLLGEAFTVEYISTLDGSSKGAALTVTASRA